MDYGMGRFEINLEWCLTRFAIFFPGVGLVVMGISILVKGEIGRRPSEGAPIVGAWGTRHIGCCRGFGRWAVLSEEGHQRDHEKTSPGKRSVFGRVLKSSTLDDVLISSSPPATSQTR